MKLSLIAALACFSFLCVSLAASAEEKTPAVSESKPLEMPDFSGLQQPSAKSGSITVDMNCQTTDGQNFKASEAGFDTCMAQQKGKQQ